MPKKSDASEEKKTSRRIKTVVEEVDPNPPAPAPVPEPTPPAPVTPPQPEPVVPTPVVTPTPDPTPQVEEIIPSVDEKAKQALSELETAHSEHKKNNRRINLKLLFFLTIVVALIVGFVAGGLYVYTTGMSLLGNEETEAEQTTAPEPTGEPQESTPEPTPTPEPVDVSEFSVSVLNGSGRAGEAGKVETLLEDAGFTIGNTGNASRFNFTDTVIQATENVPKTVVTQLEEALSESYAVEVGDVLPEDSAYDIVITVGSTTN